MVFFQNSNLSFPKFFLPMAKSVSAYANEVLCLYPRENIVGYAESIGHDGNFSDGDHESDLYTFFVHHWEEGKEYVDIWHYEFWWYDFGKGYPEGYVDNNEKQRMTIKEYIKAKWGLSTYKPEVPDVEDKGN